MAVLKNPKHERFAVELAKGKSQADAYKKAGYKPSEQHASRLARNGKISARVSALLQGAAKRAEISIADVISELAKIGFANMADYMRVGPDGDPCLDFSALSRDQAAALSEVTVEDFKDGRGEEVRNVRRVKFKLLDKRAALVDIGKHLGAFVDRVELTGKDGGSIKTEELSARDTLLNRISGLASRSGSGEGSGKLN